MPFSRPRSLPAVLATAAVLVIVPPLCAQSHAELAVADSSPFRRLDLSAPNEFRTGSGRPGPKYWQQHVD